MSPEFAETPVHRKLVYPRPPPVLRDYANLYRFGVPAGPAPLLVFVGGQLTVETHAERFESEPVDILEELKGALGGEPVSRFDFLVMPSPPLTRAGYDNHGEDFLDLFENQVLPDLGPDPPTAIAFVALSYGASLATYLALSLEASRALITLGGVGVAKSARMALPVVPRGILIELYRNDEDTTPDPALVARTIPMPLRARAMPRRPGRHSFDDYAKNGTVALAFRSGLRAIMNTGRAG